MMNIAQKYHLYQHVHAIGKPDFQTQDIIFRKNNNKLIHEDRVTFQKQWSETSYRMQALRDNPITAKQEFDRISETGEPPMPMNLTFDVSEHSAHEIIAKYDADNSLPKPRVAILREEGVNGHEEMMAAFMRAGFEAVDVHMTDLLE